MYANGFESKDDMIKWAREINFGVSVNRKCDMQDEYAHTTHEDINRFFIEAEGDRKLVLCGVYNCMAFDEVERLLSVLARHKVSKQMKLEYAELDKRESALAARERAQQDSRKPYYKKLAELNKTIEGLRRVNADLTNGFSRIKEERNAAKLDALQYEIEAEKYRKIKELLV